ncbi:MAG: hypothetical protein C5B50_00285 [Verrucomicrobia bacterium]|nr:MAG: hypothetical protein C5B50_00285 [Verrucomicrobiota bacterium]
MAKHRTSLRALFDEASDIEDPQARAAFLDEACAGDAALRAELEELLRSGESAGGFLADTQRPAWTAAATIGEREGDRIGRYKLLEKIGEGGCGVVYLAEQIEPVRRQVALKVIKLGMDTASMIARFDAERQALALMDHPGIARVLDAGATDSGRPYFVMDLVRGTKITDYCRQNGLSLKERLQLFIQVCQAVQHAHQKGIIHRDLKPSNVLVTSNDGVPLPKVIDFGIAKATAGVRLTDLTVFTRFEMFLGTPAYMSPEQADPNADDLDTRTDIYSLGVLLYELLTGRPPFESETWLKSGIDALRKAIREKEPTRPSTRLAMELKSAEAVPTPERGHSCPQQGSTARQAPIRGLLAKMGAAADKNVRAPARQCPDARATDESRAGAPKNEDAIIPHGKDRHHLLKEMIAQLRGDLDWIVLKALEKDRNRRYETANAFAMDIQRHLVHEPVVARPPSRAYLLRKTVRRNRPAFVVAAAVALVLVAGVVFAIRDAVKTRRTEKIERELRQNAQASQQQAEQARNEADAANRILTRNLFIREWLDAETLVDNGKTASALAWFARAARDHPGDAAVQTRLLSLLTENRFLGPADRLLAHGGPINNFAFMSDGRHLATAAGDRVVRLWRLDPHSSPLVLSNRFESPDVAVAQAPIGAADGRVRLNAVLVDDSSSVSLLDLNGLVKQTAISHSVNRRLPISADGRFAAICGPGSGYREWDIAELKKISPAIEGTRFYPPVTGISPDGKYLLGTLDGAQISAWEISTGRLVWQTPRTAAFRDNGPVEAEVQPDGKSVLVSCWIAEGGELSGWTFEPSLSPGGAPATAASEGWVLPTRSPIGTWCFSRDGRELYVGDAEGRLGVVNLATHELRMLNGQHDGRVTWMSLSPEGQRLVTGSMDGTVRFWDARLKAPDPLLITNAAGINDARFSPDSTWFACNGADGPELRDARTGTLLKRLALNQHVEHLDISRDGRRLVACGVEGRTMVWDARSGAPLFQPIDYDIVADVKFSRDASRFFIFSRKGPTTRICETETGRQIGPTLTNASMGLCATCSPDAHSLVVITDNGTVETWSLRDGRLLEKTARHKDVVWEAEFSPDGKFVLTASRDRTAVISEAGTGKFVREFRHEQQVYGAKFSPDGTRIVTGDSDRQAHVWEVATGRRLFSLPAHPGGVWYCEFSMDGQMLLTGDDAGNARLWEASSGLPLSGWVHNGDSLNCTHLSPDGRMALSVDHNGNLRLWPVVRAPLPAPAWLPELAEALAGRRLRDDGSPELLPAERWESLNASLSSQQGDGFYARWARWFSVERLKEHPAPFVP